jgi:hypothetical protein
MMGAVDCKMASIKASVKIGLPYPTTEMETV